MFLKIQMKWRRSRKHKTKKITATDSLTCLATRFLLYFKLNHSPICDRRSRHPGGSLAPAGISCHPRLIAATPLITDRKMMTTNAVVTCEIKLFRNYFSLRRRSSQIILPEIISKLFQRLMNIFQHVQCR